MRWIIGTAVAVGLLVGGAIPHAGAQGATTRIYLPRVMRDPSVRLVSVRDNRVGFRMTVLMQGPVGSTCSYAWYRPGAGPGDPPDAPGSPIFPGADGSWTFATRLNPTAGTGELRAGCTGTAGDVSGVWPITIEP